MNQWYKLSKMERLPDWDQGISNESVLKVKNAGLNVALFLEEDCFRGMF